MNKPTVSAADAGSSHTRPRWRVAVGIIATLALPLAAASPALASNFGKYYADNSDHYYARVSLTANGVTAANWGITELDLSTDIDTYNDGTCKSGTDICFYDANYETTPWVKSVAWWQNHSGLAHCNRAVGLFGLGNRCDRWYVLFNTADMSGFDTSLLRSLGCHEVGHTVGLKHTGDTDSCMQTPLTSTTRLSQHDRNHINLRYE